MERQAIVEHLIAIDAASEPRAVARKAARCANDGLAFLEEVQSVRNGEVNHLGAVVDWIDQGRLKGLVPAGGAIEALDARIRTRADAAVREIPGIRSRIDKA